MGGISSRQVYPQLNTNSVNDNMGTQRLAAMQKEEREAWRRRLAEQDAEIIDLQRKIIARDGSTIEGVKRDMREKIQYEEERKNLPQFNIDDPTTYPPKKFKDPVTQKIITEYEKTVPASALADENASVFRRKSIIKGLPNIIKGLPKSNPKRVSFKR